MELRGAAGEVRGELGELGSWVPGYGVLLQAGSGGCRRHSQSKVWAQWKEHWRCCGSRGKSPSAGPVPWPTSHPRQDGSLEALPRGTVVSQGSHVGGGQQGRGAFRWPPRLHPAPGDPATALGKQLRKSSGNTNPPPSPSRFLGPDPCPQRTPEGGSVAEAEPDQHGLPWQDPVGTILGPGLPAAGPIGPSSPTEAAPPQEDLGHQA